MTRTIRQSKWLAVPLAVVLTWTFLPAVRAHEVDEHAYREMMENPEIARPQPSVAEDIAALRNFHRHAKKAAIRLAEHGEAIVPQLIDALRSPEANDKQRIQIITVLGEIGDASAIDPMIELSDSHPEWLGERREVAFALSHLPQSQSSVDFIGRLLDNESEHVLVRRTALAYFAQHRDPRGRRYADAFIEDSNVDLRATALVVAARLGDESAKDPIVDLLGRNAPRSVRYALLLGLSEVTTPAELEQRTPLYLRETRDYASALRLSKFRTGSTEERLELSREMIGSRFLPEKQIAARFILREKGADELAALAGRRVSPHIRAVARHQLRRGGYRVIQRGEQVRIERRTGP